jgi:hypothetical protein
MMQNYNFNRFKPLPLLFLKNRTILDLSYLFVIVISSNNFIDELFGLQIFDAFGRMVLQQKNVQLLPVFSIQLDTLSAGVYFYLLQDSAGRVVKSGRVVKTSGRQ